MKYHNSKIAALLLIIVAITATLTLSSCAGRPIDNVSKAVVKASESYLAIQETLISAHEQGLITADLWKQISEVRWKAKPIHTAMLDAWFLYGTTGRPTDFDDALILATRLGAFIAELTALAATFQHGGGQ